MGTNILGICGSLRAKSFNRLALASAGELMPEGMTLTVAPIADIPLYSQDVQDAGIPSPVTQLRDAILAADGLLIACPEYNFSVSGVLKNAIDWMSRVTPQPFQDKPAAVLSATAGPLGGARAQYDLRRILSCLGAQWLQKPEVFIGVAQTKFGADGKLADEVTRKFIGLQMIAYADWIARMKKAFG